MMAMMARLKLSRFWLVVLFLRCLYGLPMWC